MYLIQHYFAQRAMGFTPVEAWIKAIAFQHRSIEDVLREEEAILEALSI